jgi:hypothetical protein
MVAVIDTFRDVLDGKMLPEKGLQALAATYPNIPTTNNFLRAQAATALLFREPRILFPEVPDGSPRGSPR